MTQGKSLPAVTNPVLTFRIPLPFRLKKSKLHVRCMVWENVPALRANTPENTDNDYVALFVPSEGSCVGTIHLSLTDLKSGTRAHEISHAIDQYAFVLWSEMRAEAFEVVTNEMDTALAAAGLISK